ncbi:MAG: hypothetical protein ACI9XO_000819 [Paraglaciecola sp.]|jgi:hypothetical protein
MQYRFSFLIGLLFLGFTSFAQYEPVFPTLEGDQLLDELVDAYKPAISLTYGQARDTLFGNIDSPNDSLTCVYTGYTIYLDPTLDPTIAAFQNDGPNALNAEHTYPQSLGASGLARADMHNLYSTRKDVNGARGNDPFANISDSQTDVWWIQSQSQGNIPSQNKDGYSEELSGVSFEPREEHKGNVARSMFYFYTMYKAQADAQNNTYFSSQLQTFCEWHQQDPADYKEYIRTKLIAPYQDDKPNPFVLDCTLAERSYCSDFQIACSPVSTDDEAVDTASKLADNFPNPFGYETEVQYFLAKNYQTKLTISDMLGRELHEVVNENQAAGTHTYTLQKSVEWGSGIAILKLELTDGERVLIFTKKMVML